MPALGTFVYLGLPAFGTLLYSGLPALGTFVYSGLPAFGTLLYSGLPALGTFLLPHANRPPYFHISKSCKSIYKHLKYSIFSPDNEGGLC